MARGGPDMAAMNSPGGGGTINIYSATDSLGEPVEI